MTETRRMFFSKAMLAAGAASVSIGISANALGQEPCESINCDPFPLVGEKSKISRDEFNSIANGIADDTMKSLKENGADLNVEEVEILRRSTINSIEKLFSKYYEIG